MNADQLKALDTWWRGPAWLSRSVGSWPHDVGAIQQSLPEERKPPLPDLHVGNPALLLDSSSYSSYWKLLRVTAWIFRFIRNVRRGHQSSGELTASELTQARMYWIKAVQKECFAAELDALQRNVDLPRDSKISQFNPFLDNGLIRLGGHLQFTDLSRDTSHPLLLDGKHHFVSLLIWHTHVRHHHLEVRIILSELREEFLILRARQAIKKVLHKCLPCKMAKNSCSHQIEEPLPADQVKPQKPFAVAGIDFAGPLYIKVGSNIRKLYCALHMRYHTCSPLGVMHRYDY